MKTSILFYFFSFLIITQNSNAQSSNALTSEQWLEDINYIVETIEKEHPNPYWRISKIKFHNELNKLKSEIDNLSQLQIQVKLIQLVASLRDGHTDLTPYGPFGFKSIFPIRMYQFTDGLFITAIASEYKEFAGSKVLKIGELSSQESIELASTLWNNENEYRKKEGAVFYFTSPEALKALNIIDNINKLDLTVKLESGEIKEFKILRKKEEFDLSFIFWGEMWGPGESTYITAINGLKANDYYNMKNQELPLHLANRTTFWFRYIAPQKTLYLQINTMGDSSKEKFSSFMSRVWDVVDNNPINKFILDIRYNVGGDGSRVKELVHGFIKRDSINTSEKLFTVLGRTTFSAGVNLAAAMKEHTKTNFIGSPAGAYYNHNGDAKEFELPNSKMKLGVSTIWHQPVSSRDKRELISIDIPIEFSSSDYFNKKELIVDFIMNSDYQNIRDLFMSKGGKLGLQDYYARKDKFGHIPWWNDFTEDNWNSLGYELNGLGNKEAALIIFQLNVGEYPNSWRACDSLAELYAELGENEESVSWYKKALELKPLNFNAGFQKDMIKKLSRQ